MIRSLAGAARVITLAVLLVAPSGAGSQPASAAAEVSDALGRLGSPGVLWGRLAVEEESPDGAWTPLVGAQVEAYPALPTLLAELEQVRRSARGSGREYESAVARAQKALVDARALVLKAGGKVPRLLTDARGLFVFDELPSGDWLIVAARVAPYRPSVLRGDSDRSASSRRGQQFLPRSGQPPREVEVWLTRARVGAGERVALRLTDRVRWLVGPLR